jgi:glycosyltransferase involved in cell wall biosynthesis
MFYDKYISCKRGINTVRIFLSAYACEPDKGSEPGVGWRWAKGLASRVELHLLTRESNRDAIEKAVAGLPAGDPLKLVRFTYHDLSKSWLWLKKRGLLPTMAYYALWQWTACRRFARLADEADVIHHLTFCTLLCPGFWKPKKAKFIIGPVGAPLVNHHYYPLFGPQERLQRLRGWLMERYHWLPWLDQLLKRASAIVPANSDTKKLLEKRPYWIQATLLDTGAPKAPIATAAGSPDGVFRMMYAGQLERRKGLELSLRALSRVSSSSTSPWEFHVFGKGPDMARLQGMAQEMKIAERVKFQGAVPQSELMNRFGTMDAFLFTSIRDTSAGVNLEAMAHGLPIICIAHQGVADITDDACAERVEPGTIDYTLQALADSITSMAADPARRQRMGIAAAMRANTTFSWDEKFDRMVQVYEKAIGKKST